MVATAVGAAVGIGGSLISSNKTANAAKDAASEQSAAANAASAASLSQYQQNRQDQMPWITQGTGAINTLGDLAGTSGNTSAAGYGSLTKPFTAADFVADPGYQFSLDQGQKALERSSAAKGGLLSGAALKAAQTYGQGTAAQEYGDVFNRYQTQQTNIYNRLAGIAGTGQTAANQIGTAGANATNQSNDYLTSGAASRAAGTVGAANAYTTGLGSIGSTVGGSLSNFFNPSSVIGANVGTSYPTQSAAMLGMFG